MSGFFREWPPPSLPRGSQRLIATERVPGTTRARSEREIERISCFAQLGRKLASVGMNIEPRSVELSLRSMLDVQNERATRGKCQVSTLLAWRGRPTSSLLAEEKGARTL